MERIMIRKLIVPLALASGVLLTAPAAEARDGCGLGFHRGYYGWCRPNLGYRPYAFAPAYPRFGYRGWGGGYRWHYTATGGIGTSRGTAAVIGGAASGMRDGTIGGDPS
jgi:hypothetical protein